MKAGSPLSLFCLQFNEWIRKPHCSLRSMDFVFYLSFVGRINFLDPLATRNMFFLLFFCCIHSLFWLLFYLVSFEIQYIRKTSKSYQLPNKQNKKHIMVVHFMSCLFLPFILQNHHLFLFFLSLSLPALPHSLSYPGILVTSRNPGKTRIKSIDSFFLEELFALYWLFEMTLY